jgi:hypothetical protein
VPEPNPETKKDVVWFALNDDCSLANFPGIWETLNGDRVRNQSQCQVLT